MVFVLLVDAARSKSTGRILYDICMNMKLLIVLIRLPSAAVLFEITGDVMLSFTLVLRISDTVVVMEVELGMFDTVEVLVID